MTKNEPVRKESSKLQNKFLIRSILVLVVGVSAFEAISFFKMSSMARDLSLENMRNSVRVASIRIDDELARLKTDLEIIGDLPALRSLYLSAGYGLTSEAEQYNKELSDFFDKQRERNSAYFGFIVCDQANQQLVSYFPSINSQNKETTTNSLSNCSVRNRQEIKFQAMSELNAFPSLSFYKEIYRENIYLGSVELQFNLSQYFSMVESYSLYDSGFLAIADNSGTPISSTKYASRELQTMINLSRSQVNEENTVPAFTNAKGEDLLVYLSDLENVDWTVAAFVFEEEIFAPLFSQIRLALIVIFIMILTEAVFINFFTRKLITERIELLVTATRNILKGQFEEKISLKGNDEIAELGNQFNQMTDSLNEKIKALHSEKEKVLQRENQLKGIVDNSSALINIKDKQGVYQMVNQSFAKYCGREINEVIGKTDYDLFDKELADNFRRNDELVLNTHTPIQFEESASGQTGTDNTFITVKFPLFDDKGNIYATCGIATDISERIKKEHALKEANDKLSLSNTLLESIEEGVVITDAEFNIIDVNPSFINIFGYSREELIGESPKIIRSDVHDEEFFEELYGSLARKGSWHGEIWETTKSGKTIPQLLTVTSMRNEIDEVSHYAGIYSDITDLKKTQNKLQKLAHFDSLTGLANRVLLEERTTQAILLAQREKYKVAMLFIDLDNFKYINDTLGHDVGDELLKKAAKRFNNVIRDTDTLARQGGDEFVILLSKMAQSKDAHNIAEKIREAGSKPFRIAKQDLFITTSIGIAVFPDDANDTAGLLKCSDMAMYAAKDSGKNSFQFYSSKLNHSAIDRLKIERALRKAMDEEELEVYFQPQIDAKSEKIEKFEALVRWPQADGHFIPPDLFIPIAEESGLIVKLGEWVLQQSLQAIKEINEYTGQRYTIAVNLSARQFRHYELAQRLKEIAREYQYPSSMIEFEVTESLLVEDYKLAEKILNQIKSFGFRLALDDFGTGYSSMSYLKHFPLDTLKLDKVFMQDLTKDARNQAIVSASVDMGRALGMKVICEGVETEEQFKFIQSLIGVKAQGYYFSRPLPLENLKSFLVRNNKITIN